MKSPLEDSGGLGKSALFDDGGLGNYTLGDCGHLGDSSLSDCGTHKLNLRWQWGPRKLFLGHFGDAKNWTLGDGGNPGISTEEIVGQRNSILCVCGVPQNLTSGDYEPGKLDLTRRWWPKNLDTRRLWMPRKLLLGDCGDPGSSSSGARGARGGAGNFTSVILGLPGTRP